MVMGDAVVFGAGGHARSVSDVLRRVGWSVRLVVGAEDRPWVAAFGARAISRDDEAVALACENGWKAFVAIGDNDVRRRVIGDLTKAGVPIPALCARTASIGTDIDADNGVVILEQAHVGPGSKLGCGVIVNTGAVVEHDCSIDDVVHVGPGALLGGYATCGEGTMIGTGAIVLPGRRIGASAVIAAGAVVTTDIPGGVTARGVPARW
jgi:sugar O-acyltransferase (sialic acid O-acetyltransferase NeuD family)